MVGAVMDETASVRTLSLDVPDWAGHQAGQHLDIRLTAEDGYQAERSYSIASAPGEPVAITVERLEDGEVSPYLTEELRPGDEIEVRGPIGGYFVWDAPDGGPLLLAAGGSGVVPLRSILRHRARLGDTVPTRLLYSSRSLADVIYRAELDASAAGLTVFYTLTRSQPPGGRGTRGGSTSRCWPRWPGPRRRRRWPTCAGRRVSWRRRRPGWWRSATRRGGSRRSGSGPPAAERVLGWSFYSRQEAGMEELEDSVLDGNAIGGLLLSLFGADMTAATGTCGSCGAVSQVAELTVYRPGLGTVVRCRSCTAVLMVFVEVRGITCIDLEGLASLTAA